MRLEPFSGYHHLSILFPIISDPALRQLSLPSVSSQIPIAINPTPCNYFQTCEYSAFKGNPATTQTTSTRANYAQRGPAFIWEEEEEVFNLLSMNFYLKHRMSLHCVCNQSMAPPQPYDIEEEKKTTILLSYNHFAKFREYTKDQISINLVRIQT